MAISAKTTIDDAEVARFSALAAEWWNPRGKFRPLHKFNPVRLSYIKNQVCQHFERDVKAHDAFKGLQILDIGCGGGLLCEPMARLGGEIVGADASEINIETAKIHAKQSELSVDYRAVSAEFLADAGEQFDVILNMEVVEHVADVDLFMASCCKMVKPGGLMFVATINRTAKARLLALFMAERVLRWLPVGTHDFDKLVKPQELRDNFARADMSVLDEIGVAYNPLLDQWRTNRDMDVNYILLAGRQK